VSDAASELDIVPDSETDVSSALPAAEACAAFWANAEAVVSPNSKMQIEPRPANCFHIFMSASWIA
jgi:hypothetical protein